MNFIYCKFCTCILISALAFVLCTEKSYANELDLNTKIVNIGIQGGAKPFDFATAFAKQQTIVIQPAYEQLISIEIDPVTRKSVHTPEIAEAWAVSASGLEWTFKLSDNHWFSDGSNLTAEDVKFTFDRILAINETPRQIYFDYLDSVEVVSERIVKFILNRPSNRFLSSLADDAGSIVSKEVMAHEKDGDLAAAWLSNNTAGSGPFYLAESFGDTRFLLKQNPHYRIQKRSDIELMYHIIESSQERSDHLDEGKIDIAFALSTEDLSKYSELGKFIVHAKPAPIFLNLAFNLESAVFSDRNIRMAAAHIIDKEVLTEIIQDGWVEKFNGPLPKGTLGNIDTSDDFEYSPIKARAYVAKSGLKIDKPVELIYDGLEHDVIRYLTLQLNSIGLEVNVTHYSVEDYLKNIELGNYDLAYMGSIIEGPEPSLFLNAWFLPEKIGDAGNYARFNDDAVTSLIRQIESTLNKRKREVLIKRVLKKINNQIPYLYLFQRKMPVVTNGSIYNFEKGSVHIEKNNFLYVEKQ